MLGSLREQWSQVCQLWNLTGHDPTDGVRCHPQRHYGFDLMNAGRDRDWWRE